MNTMVGNVQLADGEIQYTGDERDVDIELAPWVPIKNLNIEYYPKEENYTTRRQTAEKMMI